MVDTSFELNCSKPLAPWITGSYTVFLYKYKFTMKPDAPSLHSTRLLDQERERVHYNYFLSYKYLFITSISFFFSSAGAPRSQAACVTRANWV
jgi:hypothetical protein